MGERSKYMNVPEIRFKEFEEEWSENILKDFFTKVTSKNNKMEYTAVLTNSAEHGIIDQRDYFDFDVANSNNIGGYFIVEPDDFVYNPRVSVTAPVGPINQNRLGYTGVMSPLYLVFKIDGINKKFLCNYYKTIKWHQFMRLSGNCGARFDRLSISDDQFVKMPIIHPKSTKEEIKICKAIESLEDLITSSALRLASLQHVKTASLQSMFPQEGETKPKVRFKGFKGNWTEKSFSDLYKRSIIKNDLTFNVDKIISVANMHYIENSNISDLEYLKTYNIMKYGDIAFEGNKSKHFLRGRFVENTIGDGIVSHVFIVFKPINNEHDINYWKYAINNEIIMRPILQRCTKSSTMMTDLVVDDFLSENILVPIYEEQQQIGKYFVNLDRQIELQTQRLEKLKQIKTACLDKMFI